MARGSSPPTLKPSILRVGFLSNAFSAVNVKDAQVALRVWGEIVSTDMGGGFSVETFMIEDLEELVRSFDSGAADVVVMSPVDTIRVQGRLKTPLEPLLVGIFSGRCTEKYLLVVHQENTVTTLSGLQGGVLAIDNFATGDLPRIWVNTELMRMNLPVIEKYFNVVKYFKNPSNVVLPVFFKQVQAGIVREYGLRTMVEMNPQVAKRVRILAQSGELPRGIFSIRRDYDAEVRDRLVRICLRLHTHPKGQQMLTLFKVDSLGSYEAGMLDPIETLLKEYDSLKAKNP